jgi:hypothetical protein
VALTISSIGNGTSTTNNTTLATGATITAAVGDTLLVCIAAANDGTSGVARTATISDGSANVYTQRGTTGNQTAGAAGDGASQFFFECPVTVARTSATITVTFSGNVGEKSLEVYKMVPGTNEAASFVSVGTATAGAGRTTHSATTVSVTSGHTIFAMAAIETDDAITADSDTTNGSWTSSTRLADGGADAATMSCASAYKTVNATGNQAWACTTASGRDSVSNTIIYKVVKRITASGSSYAVTGTAASGKIASFITASGGAFAVTGQSATLIRAPHYSVAALGSTYELLGAIGDLAYGLDVYAAAYAVTGSDATMAQGQGDKILPVTDGSYSLAGQTSATLHGWKATASAGNHSINGDTAAPRHDGRTAAASASYAVTGTAASLRHVSIIYANEEAYTVTGANASLIYDSADPRIVADAGAFVITGQIADLHLVPHYSIAALAATYQITGADADLAHGLLVYAGTYSLNGQPGTLTKTEVAVETPQTGGGDGGSQADSTYWRSPPKRKKRKTTAKTTAPQVIEPAAPQAIVIDPDPVESLLQDAKRTAQIADIIATAREIAAKAETTQPKPTTRRLTKKQQLLNAQAERRRRIELDDEALLLLAL